MAEEYTEAMRREAKKIATTLKQLDALLASEKLGALLAEDVTELRRNVRKMLVGVNSDREAPANIESEDIFKTNPVFATHDFSESRTLRRLGLTSSFTSRCRGKLLHCSSTF